MEVVVMETLAVFLLFLLLEVVVAVVLRLVR
jgi:hypothetical protein